MTHYCTHCHEHNSNSSSQNSPPKNQQNIKWLWLLSASIVFASLVVSGAWIYTARLKNTSPQPKVLESTAATANQSTAANNVVIDQELVIPSSGVELPIVWGDVVKRVADAGVIDLQKFESLYAQREGLNPDTASLLRSADNGKIRMTPENSGVLLNIAWALGLGNKNSILEKDPMNDKQYGGADNFASTGGWSLAKRNVMQHSSKHQFITLNKEQ